MMEDKRIYKYVNLEGATCILRDGTLLFSSPLYFNDPFDISIHTLFKYDFLDLETFLDELVVLASSRSLLLPSNGSDTANKFMKIQSSLSRSSNEFKSQLRKDLEVNKIWDVANLKNETEKVFLNIKREFETSGVFCASKTFNNSLLWAHYADKHQGAVLEFIPSIEKDSMLLLTEDVEYSSERPFLFESHRDFLIKSMFKGANDALAEYTKKITKTKSLEWSYEEEIRLYQPRLVNIFEGKKNHCLTYHNEELRSIYLGCKMVNEQKERLIDLAMKRNSMVKIFQMTLDPYQYKILPVAVN